MDSSHPIKSNFDMEACRPVYTLGIASDLSNIPTHSIRQYIDQGLIIPFKLASRRHLFSQTDITRLKHIHSLIHERGLNFAGIRALMAMIPCWAMNKCTEEDRISCEAYSDSTNPCWEASNKGRKCRNENCRACNVYMKISNELDLKSVIKTLI